MSGARGWVPILVGLALAAAGPAVAQIATDGRAGPRLELPGPDFDVPAWLGHREGHNLFHSFERFSLRDDQSATFRGPNAIRNVISRVTGGELSDIDGMISSTMPRADFYFINPAGIVFGPNASLDVQGSFHVSTADELRFADGARFSASHPAASSFTMAPPETFGFLGAEPNSITVDGSALDVPRGKSLSLIGGNIDVRGGLLFAPEGQLNLLAVNGTGATWVSDGVVTAGERADITLRQSELDTTGDGGGIIRIRGGAIVVEEGTTVSADNIGPSDSHGGVEVDAHRLEMRGGAQLTADVFGASATGRGGGVSVRADEVEMAAESRLSANTFAHGSAGTVTVTAGDLEIRGGARIGSSTFSAGEAGTVTVEVGQLLILRDGSDEATGIVSDARAGSTETGDAGTVNVTADTIHLGDGGEIRSSTAGAGDAGAVVVDATYVLILGPGLDPFTGISSSVEEGSTGVGGTVTVTADDLELRADGKIRSVTFSRGNAGTVTVEADRVTLSGGGQISSSTLKQGTGESGDVVLTVHEALNISGQSEFRNPLSGVLPPSGIFASTETRSPDAGRGGTVTVTAPVIWLADRGEIASESFGGGNGGALVVTAERIVVDDAEITAKARRAGNGGQITVNADQVTLRNGGEISSSSAGEGLAGNIIVEVTDQLEMDQGAIATEAERSGGGRITLTVGDILHLRGSRIASSVEGDATTTAGDITIDPRFIILDGSRIVAQAGAGRGGNIDIKVDHLIQSPDSAIDASADQGIDGTVNISTPGVDLSGGLVVVESGLVDTAQLRERCASRRDIGASSFTPVGRAGLPPSPDAPLAGPHRTADGARQANDAQAPGPVPAILAAANPPVGLILPCAPRS